MLIRKSSGFVRSVLDAYQPRILRLARRQSANWSKVGIEAEDVAQMSVVRLLAAQHVEKIDNMRELEAKLVVTMRRVIVDERRKHQAVKRGGRHRRVAMNNVVCSAAEDEFIAQDAISYVARIDPQAAQAFELRLQGSTIAEVADQMGVSPRTVDHLVVRARDRLKQEFAS